MFPTIMQQAVQDQQLNFLIPVQQSQMMQRQPQGRFVVDLTGLVLVCG
jgi:hypothetical protein